jgi:hypothetical protein
VATGKGELAGTGAECVPAGLAGLVLAAGLGMVAGGDVAATCAGEAEDGVVVGVTPVVAAGGGLMSR